jgi:hypothetical protein
MKKLLIAVLFLVRAAAAANGDITGLLEEFSGTVTKGGNAARLLSPAVAAQKSALEREQSKLAPQYLAFVIKDLQFVNAHRRANGRLDVPATVHWKTRHGETQQTATLRLVYVDGAWYFADFDFAERRVSVVSNIVSFCTIFLITFTLMAKPWRVKKKRSRKAAPSLRSRIQPGKPIVLSAIPGLYGD